ncbi:hypothetical protein T492DRAFT_836288 [Pavlovales sp. CCMP2436]|nr:hypothetical protein T492DRAFT_836288 [Pavlovales sp. CCMP2436]
MLRRHLQPANELQKPKLRNNVNTGHTGAPPGVSSGNNGGAPEGVSNGVSSVGVPIGPSEMSNDDEWAVPVPAIPPSIPSPNSLNEALRGIDFRPQQKEPRARPARANRTVREVRPRAPSATRCASNPSNKSNGASNGDGDAQAGFRGDAQGGVREDAAGQRKSKGKSNGHGECDGGSTDAGGSNLNERRSDEAGSRGDAQAGFRGDAAEGAVRRTRAASSPPPRLTTSQSQQPSGVFPGNAMYGSVTPVETSTYFRPLLTVCLPPSPPTAAVAAAVAATDAAATLRQAGGPGSGRRTCPTCLHDPSLPPSHPPFNFPLRKAQSTANLPTDPSSAALLPSPPLPPQLPLQLVAVVARPEHRPSVL